MDLLYTIADGDLPSLEIARIAFNNSPASAPPGGQAPAPGTMNPQMATVSDWLKYQLDQIVSLNALKYAVQVKVTRKQGLKALARAESVGLPAPITEDDILAHISLMPETTLDERIAKIDTMTEFKNAPTWIKGNPFFESLVQSMGITPTQRDALLVLAGTFQD